MTDIGFRSLAERRRQLTHTGETVFHDPVVRQLYLDAVDLMLTELEIVPGYGFAMESLAERYVFLWAAQKNLDTQPEPVPPREYEKLVLRQVQVIDRLFKARDDRHADEAFKRQFTAALIGAMADAITSVEPDVSRAHAIQQAVIARLRVTLEGPTGALQKGA